VRLVASLLLCTAACAHAAEMTAGIPEPGPRPQFNERPCAALLSFKPEPQSSGDAPYAATVEHYFEQTPSGAVLFKAMRSEALWWIRSERGVTLTSLLTAIHETNHVYDLALSRCNGGDKTYYFDGAVWRTELRFGDTPPYAMAEKWVPASMKASPIGRYQHYFKRIGPQRGNDMPTLLDELNAHITGAELERSLIGSDIYQQFSGGNTVDANMTGTVDFMVFTLAYLRTLREDYPASWAKVKASPLLLQHLQRLWSKSEALLSSWPVEGAQKFLVNVAPLHDAYAAGLQTELDRLGIIHAAAPAR